jgi:N-methylhydantoinase A
MRIGIDIGGTFTDVVVQADDGALSRWKVPSTPSSFARGVLDGIETAGRELGMPSSRALLESITDFVHGTTVTTNIVVTRSGDRVGLLTTRGFGDTYALARQYRGSEQDPAKVTHPVPLVPRRDVEEIDERIDYAGRVVLALDEAQVEAAVRRLLDRGIRSFAVCLLWSFRNPEHERTVKRVIERLAPDAFVAASYEACPVAGEYERTSTTAITAFAGPSLRRYAEDLETQLRDAGFGGALLLMKSDGGVGSVSSAVRAAAQTVYSGPAAGVMAAKQLGETLGERNLITFDMGGTSTDVALIHEGEVRTTTMQFLDRQALAIPMIDVTTVGAGGGSIGWVAADGLLRVGPASAGATPGPACYDRGGTEATVTDANVVLGLVDPEYFLGGRFTLRSDLAHEAVSALASRLGMTPVQAATGIFRVVNAVMSDAVRLRTVFAGLDPREFTLVSFGGAGGLHCASVARELGIPRVIVPAMASVFSAAGLVSSDLVYSMAKSTQKQVQPGGHIEAGDLAEVNGIFAELGARIQADLDAHAIPQQRRSLSYSVEMSYLRQVLNFEVEVPDGQLTAMQLGSVVRTFDERYAAIYGPGAAAPESGYTLKNYKVIGVGRLQRGAAGNGDGAFAGNAVAAKGRRRALADAESGGIAEVDVYDGTLLAPGVSVAGPAIVEYVDTTVLVPRDGRASVDGHGNLHMDV